MISNPLLQKCANLTLLKVGKTKQVLAEEAAVRSGWVSVHGIRVSRVPGQAEAWLRQSWRPAQLQLSSGNGWGSRAELKCNLWVLGLWVVVLREAGQGCPVHPGPWENSTVLRAGLEWHCWGMLFSEELPHCPGALWKSLPAGLTLCRGSGVSGHAQNQCWKRPTGSSRPTGWHWFSLTRIWLLLTKWNFLTKLTFYPSHLSEPSSEGWVKFKTHCVNAKFSPLCNAEVTLVFSL